MKRILLLPPLLLLAAALPVVAEPIPPNELPRPERATPPIDYSALNPAVFEVDYFRLGLEGGLNSPLIRHDRVLAPLVERSILRQALLQVQELQNAGGKPDPDDPEEGDIREELQPSEPLPPASNPPAPWMTGGNSSSDGKPLFLGSVDKIPLQLGAANTPVLRLHPTPFAPNIVGGAAANNHKRSVVGAVIAGGGDQYMPNRVTADFATIGGGVNNLAGGDNKFLDAPFSTIAGGRGNRVDRRHGAIGGGLNNVVAGNSGAVLGGKANAARGDYSIVGGGAENVAVKRHASVGGGQKNTAAGEVSTVGGGENNQAKGVGSTVGGGANNLATGSHATVPGGLGNRAGGVGSFAAGSTAQAAHDGSFVWADASGSAFTSTGPNQFLLRAAGNVGIDTANPREKLSVGGNIAPATDDRFTLGSPSLRWRDVHLSGSIDYVEQLVFADEGSARMRLDDRGNLHLSGQVVSYAGGEGVAVGAPVEARDYAGEIGTLSTRLQELERRPTSAPETVEAIPTMQSDLVTLDTRVGQLEKLNPTPKAEFVALSTRLRHLENKPGPSVRSAGSASRSDVLALTARVDTLAASPAISRAEWTTLSARLQQMIEQNVTAPEAFAPLSKRVAALESIIAKRPALAPDAADVPASAFAAVEERIDFAVTSLSQRQSVSEQNMDALRKQAENVFAMTEALGTDLDSVDRKLPPLEQRLMSVEQRLAARPSPAAPAPAVTPHVVNLVQAIEARQARSEQVLTRVQNAQAGYQAKLDQVPASLQSRVDKLLAEQARFAEKESLEQLQSRVDGITRQIAVLDRQGPAASPAIPAARGTVPVSGAPAELEGLRRELAGITTQLQSAKRERSAIQRDQLRLLSLENKVKALAFQPPAAGAAARSNIPAPAATPPARTGKDAKDVVAMEVLGNLIALPMQTFQTSKGAGIGPDPTAFNATFGSRAPAGTIDPALAEGVALTSIQGLFQILDAQDRRIRQLEASIAAMGGR